MIHITVFRNISKDIIATAPYLQKGSGITCLLLKVRHICYFILTPREQIIK